MSQPKSKADNVPKECQLKENKREDGHRRWGCLFGAIVTRTSGETGRVARVRQRLPWTRGNRPPSMWTRPWTWRRMSDALLRRRLRVTPLLPQPLLVQQKPP